MEMDVAKSQKFWFKIITHDDKPLPMASSKDTAWNAIFKELNIHSHDFNLGPFFLSAKDIKHICSRFSETAEKEPRIICYQAQRKDRPQIFVDRQLFLLPIKNGHYVIVKTTDSCDGYVDIPPITSPPIEFRSHLTFELRSSKIGDSEMQHVDKAYALKIIQDFCGVDPIFLTIRGRKYCPKFSFSVGSQALIANGVQTEVDAGYEGEDTVVLIEAKNTKVNDIIIRQLYYPYRQWWHNTKKDTTVILFEYNKGMYHLWQFEFDDPNEYTSIRLMKSSRYKVV
jgi:hypothetical protein